VVVDAVLVGVTPWRGRVPAGRHIVLLRGAGRGTTPRSVDVKLGEVTALALRPLRLDSTLWIRPTPRHATILIDGEFVGNGGWTGGLPHGRHRIEVVASGYLPFKSTLTLQAGAQANIQPRLQLGEPPLLGIYLEPALGALLGRSVRSGIDSACDCSTRVRPLGWSASLRTGYHLLSELAVEMVGGYFKFREESTRSMVAQAEPKSPNLTSSSYRDSIRLDGPFAAIGVAARVGARFPVTGRAYAGLTSLRAQMRAEGSFAGGVEPQRTSGKLAILEPNQTLLAPFVATELRVGYQLTSQLSADLGTALALFLPPHAVRKERAGSLTDKQPADPRSRVYTLSDEPVARAFLMMNPSVSVRWSF
jgi:hypothetical protein